MLKFSTSFAVCTLPDCRAVAQDILRWSERFNPFARPSFRTNRFALTKALQSSCATCGACSSIRLNCRRERSTPKVKTSNDVFAHLVLVCVKDLPRISLLRSFEWITRLLTSRELECKNRIFLAVRTHTRPPVSVCLISIKSCSKARIYLSPQVAKAVGAPSHTMRQSLRARQPFLLTKNEKSV